MVFSCFFPSGERLDQDPKGCYYLQAPMVLPEPQGNFGARHYRASWQANIHHLELISIDVPWKIKTSRNMGRISTNSKICMGETPLKRNITVCFDKSSAFSRGASAIFFPSFSQNVLKVVSIAGEPWHLTLDGKKPCMVTMVCRLRFSPSTIHGFSDWGSTVQLSKWRIYRHPMASPKKNHGWLKATAQFGW